MSYCPRIPAEIKNLAKPVRERVALAAWRRVRRPLLLILVIQCPAWFLYFVRLAPRLIWDTVGYVPFPSWFWNYGEFIIWPGTLAILAWFLTAQSHYRRAIRDILREENIRPKACLACGWVLNMECYSCPGCGEPLLVGDCQPNQENEKETQLE